MKFGVRKPSIKRSISARTTGKIKRQIKRSVNPLYGKKGMGYINNPKKAIYNKIYNKTTFSVKDGLGLSGGRSTTKNRKGCFRIALPVLLIVVGLFTIPVGLIFIAIGIFLLVTKSIQNRAYNAEDPYPLENESTDDAE